MKHKSKHHVDHQKFAIKLTSKVSDHRTRKRGCGVQRCANYQIGKKRNSREIRLRSRCIKKFKIQNTVKSGLISGGRIRSPIPVLTGPNVETNALSMRQTTITTIRTIFTHTFIGLSCAAFSASGQQLMSEY